MTNWKLMTGPFAGSIVADGAVLDVAFDQLDEDIKLRIREWGESTYFPAPLTFDERVFPVSLEELKEDYENSWESEETEEPVDLLPVSEW